MLPEEKARIKIDKQLNNAGYCKQARLCAELYNGNKRGINARR